MNRSELRKQAQRARSGLSHLNDEANRMQNRIDELGADVERLREERRWIPVEERLPAASEGWVLCSLVGDEVYFGCWHKNEWWSIDDREGKLSDVTHWMSIPDPPVKEE